MRDREEPVEFENMPGRQIPDKADGQLTFEGMERLPVEDSGSHVPDTETVDPLTYEDDVAWTHDPQDFDFVRVTKLLEYNPKEAP